MATRRKFLVAGGSLVALSALSGCLGDGDSNGDDGDADGDGDGDDGTEDGNGDPGDEYSLEVDRFVYTTERAREKGAYTERPEGAYREGEMIWIYIDVSNVTPVSEGPHLRTSWEVLGPDGEVLISAEEPVRFAEGSLGELPNEGFVTQGIDTSAFEIPETGEYTTKVTLTDVGSGESVELSRSVTVETFELAAVVFTDGEPRDVDDYDEKPDATYARGEDVWLYTEVVNAPTDDSGKAVLEYTFEVVPPTGEPWEPSTKLNRWERVGEDEALIYWRGFTMYEDDPTGEYEVTLTIEDRVMGKQIRTTETFVVE